MSFNIVQTSKIPTSANSQSTKAHRIWITNYKWGEMVYNQIVLIKGYVTINDTCTTSCTNSKEIFVNEDTFAISPRRTFKVLIKLKEGYNAISFVYCCHNQTFELVYNETNIRRYVTPLYVVFRGHDGAFQAPPERENDVKAALETIHLNCQLIQTTLAEKLFETHQNHRTFHLTEPKLFHSDISIEESREFEPRVLFHKLACEIEKSEYGSVYAKHIAFLSGTQYLGNLYKEKMVYQELVSITKQYIALGRGGLAVFHSACLYTWPQRLQEVMKAFMDETPINRKHLLDDSNYRGTFGACYSTTLGSVLHELCHTFNLGHAEVGIMSRGFDDVRDIFLVDSIQAIDTDRRRGAHGITDSTALHKSGAQILRYNKWFLSNERELPYKINFDPIHNVLQSSWGIRVVEIRSGDEEVMTQSWIYNIAKMNVQLLINDLREKSKLFVQDSKGNWMTHDLN